MIKGIRHITPSKLASNGVFDVRHGLFSAMGVLLALEPPTKGMLSEAASAGRFQLPGAPRTYPKVQIFTVEDYFAGKRPDLPDVSDTLKKAKRITKPQTKPKLGI